MHQFECCELNIETKPARTASPSSVPSPTIDEALEASAREDRDAPSLTESFIKRSKGAPPVRIVRRALKLTQEEFATRYHIPLGTLRDWEQGRSEPDQATRAYLLLIARDPDHVNRVLNQSPDEPVRSESASEL